MIPKKYMDESKYKIVRTQFGDESIDVIYRKLRKPLSRAEQDALPPEKRDMFSFVADFNPRTYQADRGIICHQDMSVTLRDEIQAALHTLQHGGVNFPERQETTNLRALGFQPCG